MMVAHFVPVPCAEARCTFIEARNPRRVGRTKLLPIFSPRGGCSTARYVSESLVGSTDVY